jgi:hypothetical protein
MAKFDLSLYAKKPYCFYASKSTEGALIPILRRVPIKFETLSDTWFETRREVRVTGRFAGNFRFTMDAIDYKDRSSESIFGLIRAIRDALSAGVYQPYFVSNDIPSLLSDEDLAELIEAIRQTQGTWRGSGIHGK